MATPIQMKRLLCVWFARATLIALPCLDPAAQASRSDQCPKARNQRDLNECAGAAYRAADVKMEIAFDKLRNAVSDSARRVKLTDAQNAWLDFRDKYCGFVASAEKGGSMAPMQHGFCMAKITEQRTRQLRADLINEHL